MAEPERWRWTETDPYGNSVRCAESSWQHVLERRQRMAGYEMAVQATVREPDAIYLDPRGTRFTYNPAAWVVVHVAADLSDGAYAGHLISVVIRWEPQVANPPTGYVVTAYPSRRVSGRLELLEEF